MKFIEKQAVIKLRKSGRTILEIQRCIPVSKSTISIWTRDVALSKRALERIERKTKLAQIRATYVLRQRRLERERVAEEFAKDTLKDLKIGKLMSLVICACLYEGEGTKVDKDTLGFTNSDPTVVKMFLKTLRRSFSLDEKKFRVCVHLHSYHDPEKQLKFWSSITRIPTDQFIKPYLKKESGININDNYQGCASIRYLDIDIKRKLLAIFRQLSSK